MLNRSVSRLVVILLTSALMAIGLVSLAPQVSEGAVPPGCKNSWESNPNCRLDTISSADPMTGYSDISEPIGPITAQTPQLLTCTGTLSFGLYEPVYDNKGVVKDYSAVTGNTVAGLTLSTVDGELSGTGTALSLRAFSVIAKCQGDDPTTTPAVETDTLLAMWRASITIEFFVSGPHLAPRAATITGTVGTPITPVTLTPTDFDVSCGSWSFTSETLPTGLSISSTPGATLEISGTPTESIDGVGKIFTAVCAAESGTSTVTFFIEPLAVQSTVFDPEKVTICHRTHATNNPYVRITVSINSIIKTKGHSGHDEIFGDAHVYTEGIYKRAKDKLWGDIIPPDPTGTNRWQALNWTTLGKAIYNGEVRGCRSQTPQQYYNALREAGVPEKEIKRELAELEEDQGKPGNTNMQTLGYTGRDEKIMEIEKDKVTICHRTAATNNPYRKITVAASSIYRKSGHSIHNEEYAGNKVFNPNIDYPANQKRWGDIIPPDPTGKNRWEPLNWNAQGQAIYNGTVAGCKEQTYQEYYNALREDNIPKKDVMKDLNRQRNDEDDPHDVDGTQYTGDDEEVEKTEPREPTQPDNKPVIDQSLSGIVWLDRNRDGLKDDNEPYMPNIVLSVVQTSAETEPAGTLGSFSLSAASRLQPAAVVTVLTDKDGYYVFPSLGAGNWRVVAGVPDQLSVTYDSQGSADGAVSTVVPPGSSAFTWVGLVGANAASNTQLVNLINSGSFDPKKLQAALAAGGTVPGQSGPALAATGSNELPIMVFGLLLMALGALGLRQSRRRMR